MTATYDNFINGEWVGADASENINPSNTNEVVGLYARAIAEATGAPVRAVLLQL